MSSEEFLVHTNPVWRGRSDFIIHAKLPDAPPPRRFEQLWTRKLGVDRFEICCIPLYLYDVALADVVKTKEDGDLEYVLHHVVTPSGRFVFRAWLGESTSFVEELAGQLARLGALTERASRSLLAIDARDASHAQVIADYLQEWQDLGRLQYETGKSG